VFVAPNVGATGIHVAPTKGAPTGIAVRLNPPRIDAWVGVVPFYSAQSKTVWWNRCACSTLPPDRGGASV